MPAPTTPEAYAAEHTRRNGSIYPVVPERGTMRVADPDLPGCPLVEVAPGEFRPVVPEDQIPTYGVVRLRRLANGHLAMEPLSFRGWFRSGIPLKLIGIDIHRNTLYRLWKNGFIRAVSPSPRRVLYDVDSILEHIRKCSAPGFWTKARVAEYKSPMQ